VRREAVESPSNVVQLTQGLHDKYVSGIEGGRGDRFILEGLVKFTNFEVYGDMCCSTGGRYCTSVVPYQ
jgi:hypothetical protein